MTYENTSGYMRDSKRRKVSLVVFMALGDIGLVPLLLMHTHSGDTRLYLSAEYAESHIGFQAILLQTIVNVATYEKEIFADSGLKKLPSPMAC